MSELKSTLLKSIAKSNGKSFIDGDWIESPHIRDEGIRLIQTGNIGIGEFINNSKKYISENSFKKLNCTEVYPGDLLICRLAEPIGRTCFAPDNGERMITAVDVAILRVDESRFEPDYILYSLNTTDFLRKCDLLSGGTTRQRISRSNLGKIELYIPKKDIQKKISDTLNAISTQIKATQSLIAKYQQIKAGMMHNLFARGVDAHGRLRPPREQAPRLYKKSPIGWIPKEWDAVCLGDILQSCGGHLQTGPFGSQLHAYEYSADGIPVVMPQNIENGQVLIDSIARIPEMRAAQMTRHRLREGDIIIARRGELERAAAIRYDQIGWVCGTGCFIIRLGSSKINPQFLSFAYRYDMVQRQVVAKAVGTTMLSLNNAVMESLFFPYMKVEEQKEISDRLTAVDYKIASCEIEKIKLVRIKSSLMHDLLTGRVRVNVTESASKEEAS